MPPRRLQDLAECTAHVFIEHGYRRTQVSDVARALGAEQRVCRQAS